MRDTVRRTRLSRAAEFDRVYRHGRSAQHRLVVVYRFDRPDDVPAASSESGAASRIGLTVGRRVGNAVARNHVKRCLREQLNGHALLDPGCDYVAIARAGLAEKLESEGSQWLAQLLTDLLQQLHTAPARS